MLEEPLMATATAEIIAGERSRYDIQRDIKAKVLRIYCVRPEAQYDFIGMGCDSRV